MDPERATLIGWRWGFGVGGVGLLCAVLLWAQLQMQGEAEGSYMGQMPRSSPSAPLMDQTEPGTKTSSEHSTVRAAVMPTKAEEKVIEPEEPANVQPKTNAAQLAELKAVVRSERRDPSWSDDAEHFLANVLEAKLPSGAVTRMSCGELRCEFSASDVSVRDLAISPRQLAAELSEAMHEQFGAGRTFQSHLSEAGVFELQAVVARPGYNIQGIPVSQ